MKKSILLLGTVLAVASSYGNAKADVEINWENPKDYRDVQPTMQSKSKFREQTFNNLEEYINELAEKFDDGQTFKMTVTNLDLAGQVWPSSFIGIGNSGSEVRLVKDIDIPRMTFSYSLTSADGTVLREADEVKLKDMGFQHKHNPFFNGETLRYEKNMIREWFNDEFAEVIAKND